MLGLATRAGLGPVLALPVTMREIRPDARPGHRAESQRDSVGPGDLLGAGDESRAWPEPPAPGEAWRGLPRGLAKLLVPLDASDLAETALPVALALAGDDARSAIFLVSARPAARGEAGRRLVRGRARYLADTARRLSRQVPATPLDLIEGPPAAAILAAAESIDADLIAIATHGPSMLRRFRLGSVSRRLTQLSDRPVLLVRPLREDPPPLLDRVVVALDGSDFAERVLPYAVGLARDHGSELILLLVPEIPEVERFGALAELVSELRQQVEARAERYLRAVIEVLAEDGIPCRGLIGGSDAARTIVAQSKAQAAGMIVLATHGRGGIDGMLLGSVASRVARHAAVPVLLLPIHERSSSPSAE